MSDDLGRAERHALEIHALADEIDNRIVDAVTMLKQYKRGYPTGGDIRTDPEAGDCTRTEALALAGPDAVDRDQRELTHSLERALKALNVAFNIVSRYQQARFPHRPGADPADDIWCANCLRHHTTNVRYRGDECRDCYDFRLVEKVSRPAMIIDARARGERVTATLIARALGRKAS